MKTGTNFLIIPCPTNIPDAVRQDRNVRMQNMHAPDVGCLRLELGAASPRKATSRRAEPLQKVIKSLRGVCTDVIRKVYGKHT